jgi:hypothetical protein
MSEKSESSNQIFDFNKISDSQFDSNVTLFIEKFKLNDLANEYFQNIKKDDKIRQNRKDKKKNVAVKNVATVVTSSEIKEVKSGITNQLKFLLFTSIISYFGYISYDLITAGTNENNPIKYGINQILTTTNCSPSVNGAVANGDIITRISILFGYTGNPLKNMITNPVCEVFRSCAGVVFGAMTMNPASITALYGMGSILTYPIQLKNMISGLIDMIFKCFENPDYAAEIKLQSDQAKIILENERMAAIEARQNEIIISISSLKTEEENKKEEEENKKEENKKVKVLTVKKETSNKNVTKKNMSKEIRSEQKKNLAEQKKNLAAKKKEETKLKKELMAIEKIKLKEQKNKEKEEEAEKAKSNFSIKLVPVVTPADNRKGPQSKFVNNLKKLGVIEEFKDLENQINDEFKLEESIRESSRKNPLSGGEPITIATAAAAAPIIIAATKWTIYSLMATGSAVYNWDIVSKSTANYNVNSKSIFDDGKHPHHQFVLWCLGLGTKGDYQNKGFFSAAVGSVFTGMSLSTLFIMGQATGAKVDSCKGFVEYAANFYAKGGF